MTFGEKIKIVRERLFLNQEDMAKELGFSVITVSRWERELTKPNFKAKKAFHELCLKNDIKIRE